MSISDDLPTAGYSEGEIAGIKRRLEQTLQLREIIRKASGETIDLKAYEADMRHLIDTYIEADESKVISDFGEIGLVDLIVKSGIAAAVATLPEGIRKHQRAVAETIANNVRSVIIKEHLNDPAYYDRMSALLKEILADLKAQRIDYEEFLRRIRDLAEQVQTGTSESAPEPLKKSPGLRAIYHNLKPRVEALAAAEHPAGGVNPVDVTLAVALSIHETIRRVRPADWRGNRTKENEIKRALLPLLQNDVEEVERLFAVEGADRVLMQTWIEVGGVRVDVVRKPIRNVHLSVHPPTGRVRIAAPDRVTLDTIRVFAISKLSWIRRHQRKLLGQERESPREYLHRESHHVWGQRRLLRLVEQDAKPSVSLSHRYITLAIRPGTAPSRRGELLHDWHKSLLHDVVPALIRRWESRLGVNVSGYYLQRMKTKWGSCNHRAARIRLNTELVKKPKRLLEYVVVHEMAHLLEPTHGARFVAILDRHYPSWRQTRAELNALPLSAAEWGE